MRHVVSSEGIKVDPAKIEVVMNWKRPKTLTKDISLVRYYRRFIKDFMKISTLLTKLTRKNEKFV